MSGSLEHSPADVLRSLLTTAGHGTDPASAGAWPIYVANEPDLPHSTITLYDTAGRPDGRNMTDGERTEHHGVQIRLRLAAGVGFPVGWEKSRQIAVWLDSEVVNESVTLSAVSGTGSDAVYLVMAASRTSDVLPNGREPGTGRLVFTVNLVLTLRQAA